MIGLDRVYERVVRGRKALGKTWRSFGETCMMFTELYNCPSLSLPPQGRSRSVSLHKHIYIYVFPCIYVYFAWYYPKPQALVQNPQKEAAKEKTQAFQIEQDRKRQGHTRSFQPKLGRAPCHGKSLSGITFTCKSLQGNVGYDRGLNNQNRAPLSDPFTVVLQGFRVHGPSKSEHESGVHCYLQYYIYMYTHTYKDKHGESITVCIHTHSTLSWGLGT